MSDCIVAGSGRVVRVEEKTSQAGNDYTIVTVPTDAGFGENKKTTWWNLKVHGKSAEYAATLNKGDIVFFYGEPEVRAYTSKTTGEVKAAAEIPFCRITCVQRAETGEEEKWDD